MKESLWSQTVTMPVFPTLSENIKCDVAVIGGGMAGLLCAYQLTQQSIDVVVIEAARVGSGQTKNTTAKITSQHGIKYSNLVRTVGEEGARMYASANQNAILEYQRIVEECKIICNFEKHPACLYSSVSDKKLQEEAAAAAKAGISCRFSVTADLPFNIKGCVSFDGQAQFHPLKFLAGILPRLRVFENTPIRKIEDHMLICDSCTVTAKKIVVATHYPFINFPGLYFTKLHQSRS